MRIICTLLLALVAFGANGQALNPDVTQENIGDTICKRGWTKTIRPAARWTTRIKHQRLRAVGMPASGAKLYELDHIVPLEVGGAPTDERNLQMQRWDGADGARAKDVQETRLKRLVCAGRVSLAVAHATCLLAASNSLILRNAYHAFVEGETAPKK
jgi:hypothetical protein